MAALLTVITVTRRPQYLPACCETIDRQGEAVPLQHLILGDGVGRLERPSGSRHRDILVLCPRSPTECDGPSRLGALRNLAVQLAATDDIVFLDDDNRWEPDHLASLFATRAATNASFVHSERALFEPDGRPYLREEFPWARDPAARRQIWERYRCLGIVTPGSNIWRDRLPMPHSCVDLGAWVLPRRFLLAHPFQTVYTEADWEANITEDHGLATAILASRLPVASTGRPTLLYWLGGYSNHFDPAAPIRWQPPHAASR
ncbi:MAG: glycosyltransferase family 2 protein [Chloroflexota bacterium]|nr:hypothetical protein [Dehalococcoidia bacterium]MDW8253735.1 glycosyltransferase family 2 protein [Chloroflexota bacterium]